MAPKYRTRIPRTPEGNPAVDIGFKGVESWSGIGKAIVVVHSNALDKKWLKKHPEIVHEEIEEEVE